ncbi:MAG: hypothetical protein GX491_14570 [Chloroflexi bacterium]|nr:hypothetical protein [Chloroflexota bacterium]
MGTGGLNTVIVEHEKRLSQSLLWKLQRSFYEQKGVEAWSRSAVPHYITNNPFIAAAYAQVVEAFIEDCRAGLDERQPLYIVELGAGTGKFAYHFLRRLLPAFAHTPLRIVYVLTDLAERNAAFWQSNPRLQPFVEAGNLDFACFDPSVEDSIHLRCSGQALSPGAPGNPLVVLANYFFDSVPQDAFYIQNGILCETLATLRAAAGLGLDFNDPAILPHLQIEYRSRPAPAAYFRDSQFNQVLHHAARKLDRAYLQFPTGGLEIIRRLRRLAGDRLLLLSADQGYYEAAALSRQREPEISLHGGAFSMAVNFQVIDQYFRLRGGKTFESHHREEGLVISACVLGAGKEQGWKATELAFQNAVEHGGPDDFFLLKRALDPLYETFTVEQMLAMLRLSGYDSNVFAHCFPVLLRRVEEAEDLDVFLQEKIDEMMRRVWENAYPIGEPFDLGLALAKLAAAMGYYYDALDYLEQSAALYGPTPEREQLAAQCRAHLWPAADAGDGLTSEANELPADPGKSAPFSFSASPSPAG